MVQVKNIEAIALVFTVGVLAGTMVPAGPAGAVSALLLPLLALPFFFREKLRRLPEAQAVSLILATFLLLGLFCALSRALPGLETASALQLFAADAANALRARIDALPFASEGTAPLLKAFLTGDRSGLSAHTVGLFRQSGAAHLLALSGLHMGILYLLLDKLSWAWGGAPAAQVARLVLIGLGGGFFTLMTGASPSIVRAYLFILINEILRLTGRPRKASRVLCLALLVQLVLDPGVVRSTGFQLSYLAMAGIFLLFPTLKAWYPAGSNWNPLRRIWNVAALTLSCQLFTAPLSWYRFHSFPRHFLLTNLLALPLTTGFLTTAVATLALDALHLCPKVLITATDGLGRLLINVLEVIASL